MAELATYYAVFHPYTTTPVGAVHESKDAADAELAELRTNVAAFVTVPLCGPLVESVYQPLVDAMYVGVFGTEFPAPPSTPGEEQP